MYIKLHTMFCINLCFDCWKIEPRMRDAIRIRKCVEIAAFADTLMFISTNTYLQLTCSGFRISDFCVYIDTINRLGVFIRRNANPDVSYGIQPT